MAIIGSNYINMMQTACHKATRAIMRDYNEIEFLQSSKKGTNSFTDRAKDKLSTILFEELHNLYPQAEFSCNGEIKYSPKESKIRFHILSLDGYNNFAHHMPFFSNIILLEQIYNDGREEIVAGVINAPAFYELFWAEKTRGAWRSKYNTSNEAMLRLKISSRSDSLLHYHNIVGNNLICNSLAIAFFASGRLDSAIIENEENFSLFSSLASLFIKEAQGKLHMENNKIILGNV